LGGEVIPRYDGVIFDEAHQLEEVATNHFGASVSTYRVEELGRDVRRELFPRHTTWKQAQSVIDGLLTQSTNLFSLFAGEERYRLHDVDPMAVNFLSEMTRSLTALRDLLNGEPWNEEIAALIRRTQELAEDLEFILSLGDPSYVYWCERRGRGTFLSASPIEVGRDLHARLYSHVTTLVFTSATLCTNATFDYVRQRLAIPEARELVVESPFDLHEQVMLYVPDHLPEPSDPSFTEKAGAEIEEILRITQGRAFVLCTSHRSMHDLYQRIRKGLPYTTLIQGERPKHLLLEEFKTDVHSVLFATASFWEGVDVPGEALSCVIIDKLPFDPPTEPIVQARIERLQSQGINPFYEYQIPAAIITLKQGLGRLIRTENDRGLLAILDPRLHTRPYGSVFFASLPRVPLVKDFMAIKKFFA